MENFFDPQVFAAVERLELRARRLVEGFMLGAHRSPFRGVSTDFAEHRLYVQGDDTRHLDWKVYARTDHFYVKRYEQDTNMEVRFLIDGSRSMFFRSDEAPLTKFAYGATLAATLAYLLLGQGDAIGMNLFDRKVRLTFPPRSTMAHFRRIVEALEKAAPGPDTGLAESLRETAMQIKRAGMVIVVSDILAPLDAFAESLGLLNFKGDEVLLFRIGLPGHGGRGQTPVRSARPAAALPPRTGKDREPARRHLPPEWLSDGTGSHDRPVGWRVDRFSERAGGRPRPAAMNRTM